MIVPIIQMVSIVDFIADIVGSRVLPSDTLIVETHRVEPPLNRRVDRIMTIPMNVEIGHIVLSRINTTVILS